MSEKLRSWLLHATLSISRPQSQVPSGCDIIKHKNKTHYQTKNNTTNKIENNRPNTTQMQPVGCYPPPYQSYTNYNFKSLEAQFKPRSRSPSVSSSPPPPPPPPSSSSTPTYQYHAHNLESPWAVICQSVFSDGCNYHKVFDI